MILALISIACFSDVSNSLQAMLICARISNAIETDLFPRNVLQDLYLFSIFCVSNYVSSNDNIFFTWMEVMLAT